MMLLPHILNIRKNKGLFSDWWIFCRATPALTCFLFTPPPSPPRSILTTLVYSLTGLQPVTVRAGPGSRRTAHADSGGVLRPVRPLRRVRGVVLQQHGGGGLAWGQRGRRDIRMACRSTRPSPPPESRLSAWCGSEAAVPGGALWGLTCGLTCGGVLSTNQSHILHILTLLSSPFDSEL